MGATISKVWHFLPPRLRLSDPELCTRLVLRLAQSTRLLVWTVVPISLLRLLRPPQLASARGASRLIPFRVTSTFPSLTDQISSDCHRPTSAARGCAPQPQVHSRLGSAIPSG